MRADLVALVIVVREVRSVKSGRLREASSRNMVAVESSSMPKRCMIPPRSFIFLPRRVRPDTKSPRLRIDGPWTVSVKD